jgi:hypothetical protein
VVLRGHISGTPRTTGMPKGPKDVSHPQVLSENVKICIIEWVSLRWFWVVLGQIGEGGGVTRAQPGYYASHI